MTQRAPLVVGSSGLPEQIQSTDSIPSSSVADTIEAVTATGAITAWGSLVTVTAAAATTQTLPQATASDVGKRIIIKNLGAGAVTVAPNVTLPDVISGIASLTTGMAVTYEVTAAGAIHAVAGLSESAAAASSGTAPAPWDLGTAYILNDQVLVGGYLPVKANGTIAANTPFSWGTTGATWRPVDTVGLNWRGEWGLAFGYSNGDLVAYPLLGEYSLWTPTTNTTVGVPPGTAGTTWRSIHYKTIGPYQGATSALPGGEGLVPRPQAGDQRKFAKGDGTWAPASEAVEIFNGSGALGSVTYWNSLAYVTTTGAASLILPTPTAQEQGGKITVRNAGSSLLTVSLVAGGFAGQTTVAAGQSVTYQAVAPGLAASISDLGGASASSADTVQTLTATGTVTAWGSVVIVNSAAAATATLPVAAAGDVGKTIKVKSIGAGAVTVAPNGGSLSGLSALNQNEAVTYEVTAAGVVHAVADIVAAPVIPPYTPSTAANIAALDAMTGILAGQVVTVADVGGGKFAAFLFPTAGLGNQANRQLIATDQIMSSSNYKGTESGDLSSVGQDYVVHSNTFTAPIGVKRANVSSWSNYRCESNLDQQVWMHHKIKRVTGNVTVFDPGARARLGLATGQHTTTGTTENPSSNTQSRTGQMVFIDNEIDVFSGEQYIVEVYAQKRVALGPTLFVEGLIKIDWRG